MSQTRALFWKEWYEVRTFFVIAIFVFLGLPLIGAAEDVIARQKFDLSASIWVFLLGGVFAVFVGVGTVVRDLNGRLEEFWRSRPVSVPRWLVVKYLTGLAVALFTLMVPVIVELAVNRKHEFGVDPRLILAWSPFFWAAAYSMAFAIACVVRRGAHAAMLSIALLLPLYFLPQVLPPLRFLSLSWVMDESQIPEADHSGHVLPAYHRLPWLPWPVLYRPWQLAFVAGMIALCAIGLTIAILAVRRDWRVESGRKTMYWSIGGALLILFSSAAFQVGSNLTVLQTADFPPDVFPGVLRSDGNHGVMLYYRSRQENQPPQSLLRAVTTSPTELQLGPEMEVDGELAWSRPVWAPDRADVLYVEGVGPRTKDSQENFPTLAVVAQRDTIAHTEIESFPNLAVPNASSETQWWGTSPFIWKGRLYLLGNRLMIFDLADPLKPRLLSAEKLNWKPHYRNPIEWRFLADQADDMDTGKLTLPPIPELPARQRLELISKNFEYSKISGDFLIRVHKDHLTSYHLDELTETSATFRKLGRYEPTALERLLGDSSQDVVASGGFLFAGMNRGQLGGARITVFDITGERPRPVAHFALPRETDLARLCPLPNGELLAVGRGHLYRLSAPPVQQR
jgi:hypothetical protein